MLSLRKYLFFLILGSLPVMLLGANRLRESLPSQATLLDALTCRTERRSKNSRTNRICPLCYQEYGTRVYLQCARDALHHYNAPMLVHGPAVRTTPAVQERKASHVLRLEQVASHPTYAENLSNFLKRKAGRKLAGVAGILCDLGAAPVPPELAVARSVPARETGRRKPVLIYPYPEVVLEEEIPDDEVGYDIAKRARPRLD